MATQNIKGATQEKGAAAKAVNKGRKAVEKKAVKLEKLIIEYVPVDSIKPNAYNPNRQSEHDFELLKRSMEEDGFTQPIIVHGPSMTIVDGEHRWRCATALGYTEVPITKVNMTAEQMRIATLRHNRARGSEDIELSAQVLRDLRALGALDHAVDSLMLDDAEVQKLLEDVTAPEALAADEFSPGWAPGEENKDQKQEATITAGTLATSTTREAADALRAQEKAVAEAKTQEEKEAARKDLSVFRLACVFTNEQAVLVKRILGDKPAEKVLALCAAEAAKEGGAS